MSLGEINRNRLHSNVINIKHDAEYTQYEISPGGWLICVLAIVDPIRYTEKNIVCDIIQYDNVVIGSFEIGSAYGYHEGGILFPNPLPNVDTRKLYAVRISHSYPALRVTSVNAWMKNV